MKIIPYNPSSESAKALAESLDIKRVRKEGDPLKFKGHLINWGCSRIERKIDASEGVLNNPLAVRTASNKKTTFVTLSNNPELKDFIVPFTDDIGLASVWLARGAIVERHTLNGHSGEGVVIKEKGSLPDPAPLYTKYILKKEEYRVHVFGDRVILVQRKARKKDVADDKVNWKVRNLAGGFIYAAEGVDLPDHVKNVAITAIKSIGLDFGAVDIIWNENSDAYYILEINTAPGLTGRTLEAYKEAFNELR